ncbi:MAG: diacylglycerol kinase family protein [Lachnospiraceae bacterium]|nr:diacylglycerol kinase family protein [Lachnospiraceae bacterium]
MNQYYVLYNPFSSNGAGRKESEKIFEYLKEESIEFMDMSSIPDHDYSLLFDKMDNTDKLVICGGDGTLNRFVNDCDDKFPDVDIYVFPTGTGNDFLRDIGIATPCAPVLITQYLKDLPWVEINDKKYYFINNVAFGIDGWVCEIADQQKAKDPGAKANYTNIAISGLLGKYHPCNATVTVDGVTNKYQRVWMAPSMNGRFMGGGMMVAPMQDRSDPERTLTLMMFQNGGRLNIALSFPGVFTGKHIKNKMAAFCKGHDITVEFDSPRAVQLDGETILGVTKYHAHKQ